MKKLFALAAIGFLASGCLSNSRTEAPVNRGADVSTMDEKECKRTANRWIKQGGGFGGYNFDRCEAG